ncbi:Cys-tRNA(Pro) deacylase [Propionibacteriaceae bacterium Y1700]|uniref:Cys-tRNA(Pro) deacylase n=1 Tax=Microlunatus sp. Y1700 TaxID=3418487 RepID=UPI003DA7A5C2
MLASAGISYTVHAYHHDAQTTDYGAEAAAELGVDPGRLFKTLVCETGGGMVVAVVPVAGRLDTKALAARLGVKTVDLAQPSAATRSTGYVVGGISPIGQRSRLPTVLDASALDHELIMVSAGRRGLQVELAPADLLRATAGSSAWIAR